MNIFKGQLEDDPRGTFNLGGHHRCRHGPFRTSLKSDRHTDLENTLGNAAGQPAPQQPLGSESQTLQRASRAPLAEAASMQHPSLAAAGPLGPAFSADVQGERRRERGWAEPCAARYSASSATPPRARTPPAPPGASFPVSRGAAPRSASAGRWGARAPLRLFLRPPRCAPRRPSASGQSGSFRPPFRGQGAGRLRGRGEQRLR